MNWHTDDFQRDEQRKPRNKELMLVRDKNLLKVFQSQTERTGSDVLQMPDITRNCLTLVRQQIDRHFVTDTMSAITPETIGIFASIVQGIQDMNNAETLVANLEALPEKIKEGLKSGLYHIATSKKVGGDYRAAVVDAKNKIKAQITLKQGVCTSSGLITINNITVQAALQQIQEQLACVMRDVNYLITFTRRESLQTPFLNARSVLLEIENRLNDDKAVDSAVTKAREYLREGLNSLYSDLDTNLQELVKLQEKSFSRIEDIDKCVGYISEDMNLIPKYVGLRAYLFSWTGDETIARNVIEEYQRKMQSVAEEKKTRKGLTAAQCLHKYFPYNDVNRNFWITDFIDGNTHLQNTRLMSADKDKTILYISQVEEQ